MLFHPGAVPDTKIYFEMLEELKRRRILRYGDLIIADKGYYSYVNYELSILRHKIIPLIYFKKNMRKEKILSRFCYLLECFSTKKHEKPIYRRIVSKFRVLIDKWKDFKNINR
ncbi:MAG: Pseudogene of transposase [Methanobrevibacter sp. CfCl-M3]